MTSIIICSIHDGKFQACERMYQKLFPAGTMEMIRIPDAKSLAEGYNRGIAQSKGDRLLLVHDDLEILSTDLPQRLDDHFNRFDFIGIAGTSLMCHPFWLKAGPPHIQGQVAHPGEPGKFTIDIYSASKRYFSKIQAVDGLFMAMKRAVAEQVKFDEQTFDGFHVYDVDFSFRAHLAGFKLGVACDIHCFHHSGGSYDQNWSRYATVFQQKFAGKLAPLPIKEFYWTYVMVKDRAAIKEVMTPPNWDD